MRYADLHQHLWTGPLIDRLAGRGQLPLISDRGGKLMLRCPGEVPWPLDVRSEAPARRAQLVDDDGLDLAVIALSSPIGIETLPRDEAIELIEAHLEGVLGLDRRFAAWGPLALEDVDPSDVDRLLDRGCVGISLPASALASRHGLSTLGPVLDRIAARRALLFVHPGSPGGQESQAADPGWWTALTAYVAQMQAAWLSFMAFARPEHPNLRVIFAMLAGCAPLQAERLTARGGPRLELRDPDVFYDTSSYGEAAVTAVARLVGERQLVYGSDRPVVEPVVGRWDRARAQAAALLSEAGVPV